MPFQRPDMDAACLGAGAREHACGTRGRARPGGAALRRAGVHHAGWLQEDRARADMGVEMGEGVDVGRKGAGVLREKPNINWNKDRARTWRARRGIIGSWATG